MDVDISDNLLRWDGSYLGKIDKKCQIKKYKCNKTEYWKFNILGNKIKAIVKKIKDKGPCIYDEMKVLFGLEKIGTHSFRHKSFLYIIYKPFIDNGKVKYEYTLKELKEQLEELPDKYNFTKTKKFIDQMKRIYTYRNILGTNCNYDSSIIIRRTHRDIYGNYIRYPVSFHEPLIEFKYEGILSNEIYKRWFYSENYETEEPYQVSKRMFNINTRDDILDATCDFRNRMQEIIYRIDSDFIQLDFYIIERLTEHLLNIDLI